MPERFFGSKVYMFDTLQPGKNIHVINSIAYKLPMGSNIATDIKDKQEKFASG